jgi:hypothetical protein
MKRGLHNLARQLLVEGAAMKIGHALDDLLAGVGLGLLTGILLGLSTTSVVGSIIAALSALLAGFFGLGATPSVRSTGDSVRAAAFGFACTIALVVALVVRTHDLASPSIAAQVGQFTDAHYTESEARALVAFRLFGVVPTGMSIAEAPKSPSSSILFGHVSATECSTLTSTRFANTEARIDAMRNAGGKWKDLANAVSAVEPNEREALVTAAYSLACN